MYKWTQSASGLADKSSTNITYHCPCANPEEGWLRSVRCLSDRLINMRTDWNTPLNCAIKIINDRNKPRHYTESIDSTAGFVFSPILIGQ